jgi:hypothetical protein
MRSSQVTKALRILGFFASAQIVWAFYIFILFYAECTSEELQGDRKFTQPIPNTCFFCQKINYIEIIKQKTMLY